MRSISVLIFSLAAIIARAQIDKEATAFQDYSLPNGGYIHTMKVKVTNNYDKCKILFLRNDEEVTGLDFSGSGFKDPITFLSEYGGHMFVDEESWISSPFGVWFKKLDPGATFTFYFLSDRDIDIDRLLSLIRFSLNNFCDWTKAMEAFGWKEDEIVIQLHPK